MLQETLIFCVFLCSSLANIFFETDLISRNNQLGRGEEQPEIPGAYQGCCNYSSEPSLNLHAKLVRFLPELRQVKLNDGRYCQRISLLGSDGEIYYFVVLQTSDQIISSMVCL